MGSSGDNVLISGGHACSGQHAVVVGSADYPKLLVRTEDGREVSVFPSQLKVAAPTRGTTPVDSRESRPERRDGSDNDRREPSPAPQEADSPKDAGAAQER